MKYHSLYTLLVYWKPYTETWLALFSVTDQDLASDFSDSCHKSIEKGTVYIDFILLNFRYPFHSKYRYEYMLFHWSSGFFFWSTCWFFLLKAIRNLFNSHWNNCSQTPTTLFTHLAKEDVSAVSLYVRELFLHHIFHVVASPSILI